MKRSSRCLLFALLILLFGFGTLAISEAGIRGPGKYSGVVIFDRRDACILYSGIYLMYVSEGVKEQLREHSGKPVEIDATEVFQPMNPGDGLIKELKYLGEAPVSLRCPEIDGIQLQSTVLVGQKGHPVAVITMKNVSDKPVKVSRYDLAMTLLMRQAPAKPGWGVADGNSIALITRVGFGIGGDEARWKGNGFLGDGGTYEWTIGEENALPPTTSLAPKATRKIEVRFKLPDGEYDFLCGYGGGVHDGRCLASNLASFDIKNGKAIAVASKTVAGR